MKKLLLLILIPLVSCSSTALIVTDPPGAKVYIDGVEQGETPYLYEDKKVVFSTTRLRLEKEGYKPIYYVLTRNEDAEIGPLIGGFFIWPFWLWALGYNDVQSFTLQPETQVIETDNPIESDRYARLRELKKLYDEGILTEEEYEREKKKILEED